MEYLLVISRVFVVLIGLALGLAPRIGLAASSFNAPPALEVSFRPVSTVLRDLDGDLDLDLVVVCRGEFDANQWNGSLVHVFLNPGDGSFPVRADYAVPAAPGGLAVADLNGDATLDLVTANTGPENLQVLLNDGQGGFVTGAVVPTGTDPVAVTAADFDGDGDVDLASADQFAAGITVARNGGNAQFPVTTFYGLAGAPFGILSGDVDHDLDVDLLVFLNDVVLLRNDGTGQFAAPEPVVPGGVSSAGELVRFDGDDHLDLVTGSRVWPGLGDGTFASTAIPTGLGEGYARAFDFDRDGRKDVVSSFGIALADGSGGFLPPLLLDAAPQPGPVAAGDVDGDQVPDLVRLQAGAAGPLGFAVLRSGRGDGSVTTWPRWPAGNSVWSLAAADVDRDGLADAVVGNLGTGGGFPNGSVSILRGSPGGTLGPLVANAAGNFVRATRTGDLNGDGAPEIVVTNRDAGTVSVFVNDGSGGFAPRVPLAAGPSPEDVILVDLDGDLDLDLAVSNAPAGATAASVTILHGDGAGGFPTSQTIPLSGNAAVRLVAEDFDGNGSKDLAVVCAGGVSAGGWSGFGLHVLPNLGGGSFGAAAVHATTGLPRAVAAGDLDGDLDADLVVTTVDAPGALLLSGYVQAYANDGKGSFGSPLSTFHRVDHFSLACADFDGDGHLDLALPYLSAGVVCFFLGDGTGSFPGRRSAATGTQPRAVALADFDLDGFADLAVAHGTIHEAGVLLTRPRTVAAGPREFSPDVDRAAAWNWPNPFAARTRVVIDSPSHAGARRVFATIADLSGRRVRALELSLDARGRAETTWDGTADSGERLPAGIYFLRLAGERTRTSRKLVLTH